MNGSNMNLYFKTIQKGGLRVIGFPSDDSQTNDQPRQLEVVSQWAKNILRQEGNAILQQIDRLDNNFIKAINLILNCNGKIIVSGMGKAGLIGQKIAATLASTGTPAHFLHPAEAVHGDLGVIARKDLLLILSHSGETEEILRLLPTLRRMGIVIISMTASPWSSLGRYSNAVLSLGTLVEADTFNLAPSTSTTVMLALGDALALSVSKLRGFCDEDFARFHPGGTLGRRLSCVEEYMRPIDQCRICRDSMSVREIFSESKLPGRRSGAIILVDQEGKLSGIFTDSDLARIFEQKDFDKLEEPVCQIMTQSPKVIQLGERMQKAIDLMAERKISELPVLDENNIPIGMLDITDLVSFFPQPSAEDQIQ